MRMQVAKVRKPGVGRGKAKWTPERLAAKHAQITAGVCCVFCKVKIPGKDMRVSGKDWICGDCSAAKWNVLYDDLGSILTNPPQNLIDKYHLKKVKGVWVAS